MRLVLVRHGDAHAGFVGPIGGPRGCSGLTDLGRQQARLVAARFAEPGSPTIDEVITSRIPRAIETARFVTEALGVADASQDCDVCEVHTGDADGMDWSAYRDRFGAVDMHADPDRPFAPGGDSWNSFHERVSAVMDRLARERAGRTIMVVCHAGVIAASLRVRFRNWAPTAARLVPTHTGLTTWEFDPATSEWTLRGYDDARHLER